MNGLGSTSEALTVQASFLEMERPLDGLFAQARGWQTVGDVLVGISAHARSR
ncbi:hypothetical protein ABT160_45870 [Streptomyces sp. NPDC001941]|uniref:hypothetical protein n=1 Tax=Streptomyces sp. NPDC001941 TaxID=3154659 RepID=UPI003318D3D8